MKISNLSLTSNFYVVKIKLAIVLCISIAAIIFSGCEKNNTKAIKIVYNISSNSINQLDWVHYIDPNSSNGQVQTENVNLPFEKEIYFDGQEGADYTLGIAIKAHRAISKAKDIKLTIMVNGKLIGEQSCSTIRGDELMDCGASGQYK